MKRIALLLLVAVACRSTPSYGNTATGERQLAGAASPREAVQSFLAAVKSQDLQAMSVIWGTSKGPARDQVDRAQLERRELIMLGPSDRWYVQDVPLEPVKDLCATP